MNLKQSECGTIGLFGVSNRESSNKLKQADQLSLLIEHPESEDPAYLSCQLITYIGNKRALLGHIGYAVEKVKHRIGKSRIRILDAFSGSGAVSRLFKAHADLLISNDIEDYAVAVAKCYLQNRSSVDMQELKRVVDELNRKVDAVDLPRGFIEELYAPKDENNITKQDRVFYTRANARRLDNYRRLIEEVPDYKTLLLGPLLSEASVHANTAGVFKGFYKNRKTGIGQFGGTNSDALNRIKGQIVLEPPVLSRFECETQVFQEDANVLVRRLKDLDLAYFDPPYNQHPYGSNYFMLNLLVNYERPKQVSKVSGIPVNWKRSDYNVRSKAAIKIKDLLEHTDTKYILVSFNNEGFIEPQEMYEMLNKIGPTEVVNVPYNAFRGSRNLHKRSILVTEQLFLTERC
jgi:adenine-specific DNA-methyltransferase